MLQRHFIQGLESRLFAADLQGGAAGGWRCNRRMQKERCGCAVASG